jgi:hypothetical protein
MSGMKALKAIESNPGALFGYYPATFKAEAKLDIETDKVQEALRRYRE